MSRCKYCGREIDKENEEYVKTTNYYYHTSCREDGKGIRFCQSCKQTFTDTDEIITYKGKKYHKDCFPEIEDRTLLYDYCCKLWGLKSPGPVIISQAKKYRSQGYTFRGMYYSLVYFYEVKGNDRNKVKGEETIGIIPYIYNDARKYYEGVNSKQTEIANDYVEPEQKEVRVKHTRGKKLPQLYEF